MGAVMKKPFKIAAYVLGVPVFIVLLFTIIIVIRFALSKDIPPPDDSDLRVIAAPIPDEQNAYQDIVTIAKEYKELEAQDPSLRESVYDAVEGFRSPPEICLNLPQEHPAIYQAFLSASSKEAVQPPTFSREPSLSDLTIKKPYFDLLKAAKFIDCHARALMVAHRENEAININERIMRLGQLVLNAGDGIGSAVGGATLSLGMSTLRDFARAGNPSSAQLLSSLRALERYGVNRESILNLLSSEYNYYLVAISSIADDVGSNHLWFQPNHTQKMLADIMHKHFKELENPCLPSPADKDLSKEERSIYESLRHDGEPLPKASLRIFFKTGHDIVVGVDRSIYAPLFGKAFSNFREKASSILTLVSIIVDPNGIGTMLTKLLDDGLYHHYSKNFCDITVDLTGTQLVLALWAYHQDRGHFPDQLVALVPDYLSSIPKTTASNEPIIYSKEMNAIQFGNPDSGKGETYTFGRTDLFTEEESAPELEREPEPISPSKQEAPAPQALPNDAYFLKQKPDQIVKVTISQETLTKIRKNIDSFFADFRGVPNFSGGQVRGMKVLSLKKDGILEQLGFKEKDVFLAIDKTPLNLKDGFSVFQRIGPKSQLLLQRDGKLVRINLVVH